MPKVKLNLAGFRQVRQSAGAMHVITEQAKRIADTANELAKPKTPTTTTPWPTPPTTARSPSPPPKAASRPRSTTRNTTRCSRR